MAEEHAGIQQRLQNAVDATMRSINSNKVRPLQKQAYLNMAACFDRSSDDHHVERCVEHESQGVKIAQQIIGNEMNSFSNRVQRCVQEVEDSTRDAMGSADLSDPRVQEKATKMMTKGTAACVDKHVAMLKSIQSRIEGEIDNKTKRH